MGKYRSEKSRVPAIFTQWSTREEALIFSKVGDRRHVRLLKIYFRMIPTACAQQLHFYGTRY